jgi:hypothetical protein
MGMHRPRRALAAAALCAIAALPAAAGAARTQTRASVYEAFSYHGVVIPHAQVQPGYCTGSSQVTLRLDAWRCTSAGMTLDPCFSSEFADNVVCPTPWNDTAVEINLARPLPKPTNRTAPSLRLAPWAIETLSGADCLFVAGSSPRVEGRRLNYTCNNHTALYGYPNRHGEPWTIASAPAGATTLRSHASILHAWM